MIFIQQVLCFLSQAYNKLDIKSYQITNHGRLLLSHILYQLFFGLYTCSRVTLLPEIIVNKQSKFDVYSETSLNWPALGPKKLAGLEGWPVL
jgi:hypothetical protein